MIIVRDQEVEVNHFQTIFDNGQIVIKDLIVNNVYAGIISDMLNRLRNVYHPAILNLSQVVQTVIQKINASNCSSG